MGKLMDEDISGKTRSNVFYDSFKETVTFYGDQEMEVWEEAATVSLINTDSTVGLFDLSDIIIVYDSETGAPSIVTERVYKKNYSFFEWGKLKRYMRNKTKIITQELGFNVRVSYSRDYIDYVHYKEEWWQWALRMQKERGCSVL